MDFSFIDDAEKNCLLTLTLPAPTPPPCLLFFFFYYSNKRLQTDWVYEQ